MLIKTEEQLKWMRKAGKVVAACHLALAKKIVPGITTNEIDRFVDWYLAENGAYPAQKGYKGYAHASCTSVNHVACHGIPSAEKLNSGDIITVDFVADINGWKADSAWTYIVGQASPEVKRLVKGARNIMRAGIHAARVGNDVSEIGYAINAKAEEDGLRVIRAFTGHGIGQQIHEHPQILHFPSRPTGIKLEEGMVITIEPIVTNGIPEIFLSRDGWTAYTVDMNLTAQFEHTVLITKKGPEILTSQRRQRKQKSKKQAKL